jgi:hypothetical protein
MEITVEWLSLDGKTLIRKWEGKWEFNGIWCAWIFITFRSYLLIYLRRGNIPASDAEDSNQTGNKMCGKSKKQRKVKIRTALHMQHEFMTCELAHKYRMSDQRSIPGRDGIFFRHRVQTDSGAHPASYTVGIGGSFSRVKAAGAWSWPLISV